jgi:hypothetical protein
MSLTVTHDIGSRDPLRRFHTRAVFTVDSTGQGYGTANFPAVRRPSNVSGHRHQSVAFRPPTTPMRFFCPTALSAGPIHSSAGFTCPLRSVRRVWSPSRRLAPGPTSPALFQTGCVPGLDPSEVAHACGGAAFLPFRTDRMVSNPSADPCKHVNTAGSAISRFCPARMPVVRRRMLLRHLARASPGLLLLGVCSSISLAGSSARRRPLACPPPVTRVPDCHSAYSNRSTIPIRKSTGHSR